MAGMYPDNQELDIFGEKVQWPGVDSSGKFSNGSFQNPLEKPSFIPAETINLILDNLSELIKKLGGTPDNTSIDQLAKLFTVAATANAGIMRDASGRAKVAAPEADDDIARKVDVRNGDATIKDSLDAHIGNRNNPHSVTKAHIGLGSVDNTPDSNKIVRYANSSGEASKANQLQAFVNDNFTGGAHFIKAIRENGWQMRLFGCYDGGAKQADCVCVNYANSANVANVASSANSASRASVADNCTGNADTVDGWHAGTGTGMLVPVTAFSITGGTGYIKFGNGLLLQWGTTGVTPGQSTTTVYFPVAFSSDNYSISGAALSTYNGRLVSYSLAAKKASYISVSRWRDSTFDAAAEAVWFIAIGR